MTEADVLAALDGVDSLLVVAHAHADLDALGSGVALVDLVEAADGSADATLVAPDGLDRRARRLRDRVSVPVAGPDAVDAADYDRVVVVDAAGSERVASVDVTGAAATGGLVVVDHHEPGDLVDVATATLVEPDAPATAELVARLADEAGWEPSPEAAFALAAGLLDDTGNLVGAGAAAYRRTAALLSAADAESGDGAGTDAGWLADLPVVLDRTPEFGERVARATAVVRATGYRADRTLVLVSDVGGHQAAAADALRTGGADVAVVFTERDDRIWVTGRCSRRLDVDLPTDLLDPLAAEFGGESGGHAGAGVAKLDASDVGAVRERTLELLSARLDATLSPLS